jgi:membrane protease YdiL (CAAX protease family)
MLCRSLGAPCLRYNNELWSLVQNLASLGLPSEPMNPRFVSLAAVFYAALLLAAVVVGSLGGQNAIALGNSPVFGLFVGVISACGTVALGVLLYRLLPALRRLSDELAPHLVDGAKRRDLVLLSIFSGVGEEALFRGALQPEIGLVASSLLFGVLHVGPDRRYLVWTLWAVAAGFLFGLLYLWTGGILAPVTAHVMHNAATLLLWKRSRQKQSGTLGETAPAEDAVVRDER